MIEQPKIIKISSRNEHMDVKMQSKIWEMP